MPELVLEIKRANGQRSTIRSIVEDSVVEDLKKALKHKPKVDKDGNIHIGEFITISLKDPTDISDRKFRLNNITYTPR